MCEYMEQHEYSKMIGSPPGYLGYGEEGHLTGAVAKLGHCVVLFDEVEKAHPNCLRLFLQLFDEGVLTDGKGKRVDFSQCVIVHDVEPRARAVGRRESAARLRRARCRRDEPSAKRVLEYLLQDAAVGVRQPHRRPGAVPQLLARGSVAHRAQDDEGRGRALGAARQAHHRTASRCWSCSSTPATTRGSARATCRATSSGWCRSRCRRRRARIRGPRCSK